MSEIDSKLLALSRPARRRPDRLSSALGAADLAQLAILGLVYMGTTTVGHIMTTARLLARPEWQPTTATLESALETALDRRHLNLNAERPENPYPAVSLSVDGAGYLRRLLRHPAWVTSNPVGRAAMALKISFLDALTADEGRAVLTDLLAHHRDELASIRTYRDGLDAACPHFQKVWCQRQVDRAAADIAWIEHLRSRLDTHGATVERS